MNLQLTHEQKLALQVRLVKEQLAQRRKLLDPTSYGLPAIKFPQADDETDAQFRLRREEAVRAVIEDHLFFEKDGKRRKIKLIPEQLRLVTDLLYGYCDKAILWKCCHPTNTIITSEGLKPIAEIRPGDLVWNKSGEPVKVLDVGQRPHKGKLVSIKVGGYSEALRFTPDHKLFVTKMQRCWKKKFNNGGKTVCTELCRRVCSRRLHGGYAPEWVRADQVTQGDIVILPSLGEASETQGELPVVGVSRNQYGAKDTGGIKLTPDLCRLLGYWLAEGSISKKAIKLTFGFHEAWLVNDVAAIVEGALDRKLRVYKDAAGGTARVEFTHTALGSWLSKNGLAGAKKGMPIATLNAMTSEGLQNLLIGLFRGDGHAAGNCVRYTTISPRLAALVWVALSRLGVPPSMSELPCGEFSWNGTKKRGKQFYFRVSGEYGRALTAMVWGASRDCPKIQVGNSLRKWAADGVLYSRVDAVSEETYDGVVHDIEVSSGESFCAPYMAIHNSRGGGGSLMAAIIIWMSMVFNNRSFVDMAGCVLPGTPTVTLRGIKPIEDVVEGESLVDLDGNVSRVLRRIEKEWAGDKITVSLHGMGSQFQFTPDHVLFAAKSAVRRSKVKRLGLHNRELEEVEAGDLRSGDALFFPSPSLSDKSSRGPSISRFIGYWLAEGSIYRWNKGAYIRLDCSTEDTWLDDAMRIIRSCFHRSPSYDEPGPKEVRIRFGHTAFAEELEREFGKGAHGKRLSDASIAALDKRSAEELLKGYLLGDGCFKRCGRSGVPNEVCATTVSMALAHGIFRLGLALGYTPSIREECGGKKLGPKGKQINKSHAWMVSFGGEDARDLLKKVWGLSVARKARSRRAFHVGNGAFYAVQKVERSGYTGLVYDLQMEDHPSFCAPFAIHNSGDQAKAVYDYTCQFWDCIPGFKQQYLSSPPLQSATITKGGAKLQCVACSEKAVRGKHPSGFVADESCQENDAGGNVFSSAMQMPMSEEDHLILLLSTFHHPFGFFADHWDDAEELGFTRYKWDIYDTMAPCTAKCDCLTECPLTRMQKVRDFSGKVTGEELVGCCGKARTNKHGYMTRKQVIEIMKMNLGTDVFEVEFECARPGGKRKVIPEAAITAATVREKAIVYPPKPPKDQPSKWECLEKKIQYVPPWEGKVGIDWGYAGQMAMVLVLKCEDYISVLDTRFMSGMLVASVMEVLRGWEKEYDFTFEVYADLSHPFNNAELSQNGFSCLPVNFKTYKEIGYQNLQKYFAHRKIRLVADKTTVLRDQLKKLKKDATGKIVKKDDHGPDAFMCAMLGYPIPEVFPEVMAVDEDAERRKSKKDQDRGCVLIGA